MEIGGAQGAQGVGRDQIVWQPASLGRFILLDVISLLHHQKVGPYSIGSRLPAKSRVLRPVRDVVIVLDYQSRVPVA